MNYCSILQIQIGTVGAILDAHHLRAAIQEYGDGGVQTVCSRTSRRNGKLFLGGADHVCLLNGQPLVELAFLQGLPANLAVIRVKDDHHTVVFCQHHGVKHRLTSGTLAQRCTGNQHHTE